MQCSASDGNAPRTVERFVNNNKYLLSDINSVYKDRCVPQGCPSCPSGSYCYTCSNCRVQDFDSNYPVRMLECMCKKHPLDGYSTYSVLQVSHPKSKTNSAASVCEPDKINDIANCYGQLRCGSCFNSPFYTFDGHMKWQG